MPTKTGYTPGTFCWVELATSDAEGAKEFYRNLFGWDVEDSEVPGGGVYSTFKIDGQSVCAGNQQQEEEAKAGVPPHWNSYISVEDVDQTAKVAEAAGATIVAQPFDVMELGRMAVLTDPTGAFVCLWQPGIHFGAQVVTEDNAYSWNELATKDPARAKQFYTEVFGWDTTEMDAPNGTYTMFKNGDDWTGGMMEVQDVPPYWGIYFQVADAVATAAKAKELGGQVMMGPDKAGGVGTIAVLLDPQGAAFGIIQPERQA